jgi:pimeloyl-ACP methyl ester carboxylesterase
VDAACAHAFVDDAGPGAPWLTLVHGATQSRALFDAQVDAFAARYRLLLVDLPGHGASASLPGPYGPLEYARGVGAAMHAAGVDRTHYWGTHTGSAVALVLAASEPERFQSLVLEGVVIPGRAVASVTECLARARSTLRERGLAAAREEWFQCSPWFDVIRAEPRRCRASAQRALIDQFEGAPWRDDGTAQPMLMERSALAAIDLPVLLYNGEHEVADFLPAARELEETLPRACRKTVPATGGFPLWEDPRAVNALVADFLDSAEGATATRRRAPAP